MRAIEFLDKLKKAMVNDLQEAKAEFDPGEEAEDLKEIDEDIAKVEAATTIGGVATVACDSGWDVDSWTTFMIEAVCDDPDRSTVIRGIIGDIPDHWST